MYFNNYGYNPNQYMQQYGGMSGGSVSMAQRYEIIRVTGENGARAFQMAPNSSAILLDETAPLVWLVQTDGAGYKTATPYKIEPYTPEAVQDVQSLEARIKRLEDVTGIRSEQSARSLLPLPEVRLVLWQVYW